MKALFSVILASAVCIGGVQAGPVRTARHVARDSAVTAKHVAKDTAITAKHVAHSTVRGTRRAVHTVISTFTP
jgi:V8-like Glu-specific endopeptidase